MISMFIYQLFKSSLLKGYCYLYFNNYFVEHIRGDLRCVCVCVCVCVGGGGGSSRKYGIKKGGHLLFT